MSLDTATRTDSTGLLVRYPYLRHGFQVDPLISTQTSVPLALVPSTSTPNQESYESDSNSLIPNKMSSALSDPLNDNLESVHLNTDLHPEVITNMTSILKDELHYVLAAGISSLIKIQGFLNNGVTYATTWNKLRTRSLKLWSTK